MKGFIIPGPTPHSIFIEPMFGGTLITFENYLGLNRSPHRLARAETIAVRIAKNTWKCASCSSSLPIWKRADAIYCGESCRKKDAYQRRIQSYLG